MTFDVCRVDDISCLFSVANHLLFDFLRAIADVRLVKDLGYSPDFCFIMITLVTKSTKLRGLSAYN